MSSIRFLITIRPSIQFSGEKSFDPDSAFFCLEDESEQIRPAYVPADLSGGYLLEMDNRYNLEDCWFETETRHIVIKSPEMPSVGEYNYISSYVRDAEKALLADSGINPETGISCFEYFDLDSWARMYLMQEFFIQADDEFEPAIRNYLDLNYDQTVSRLQKDTELNFQRWDKDYIFTEWTDRVKELMEERVNFFHDYYCNPDDYHRLLFEFEWGDLSYYIRDGAAMGFVPTAEFGEKQSKPMIKGNGLIEKRIKPDGTVLTEDEPIYTDLDLKPEYEE